MLRPESSPTALQTAYVHARVDGRGMPVITRVLLAALSGALVCAPWLYPQLYLSAWIGWVPLLVALRQTRLPVALLLGWVTGTLCFAGASYWLVDFAVYLKGLTLGVSLLLGFAFWLYAGLSIGFGCLLYRWLDKRLPNLQLLSFPLSVVLVMTLYPLLFETHFAEAQAGFLIGLQGVSLVGAKGLDLIMLLSSVVFFQLVFQCANWFQFRVNMAAGLLLLIWFGYGLASLNQWDDLMAAWDRRPIGLVQPNDSVTLEVPAPAAGFTREYPQELAATRRLAEAGARWVIWPEARYKGYFDRYSVRQSYAQQASEWGVSLVFHDAEKAWISGEQSNFNSLVHINDGGEQQGTYRKVHRMPFGEYLPAIFQLPGLDWLTRYFLGEFLQPIQAGDEHVVFTIDGMRIVPKICYETAFPAFIAQAVGADASGKVLLFLSQDNWFGETTQPFQHSAMSVVRGVENRLPMIHLINNGPSVVAAPNGRIIARTEAFSRTELLVNMPFSASAGGSFYSRHPQLLPLLLYASLVLLILLALFRRPSSSP